jgi:hypothetical protein
MNIINRDTLPLLSFIIGLGFAVLFFHKPFQMTKMLALPVNDIHGKTVRVDGKCYRYIAEDTQCEILSSK